MRSEKGIRGARVGRISPGLSISLSLLLSISLPGRAARAEQIAPGVEFTVHNAPGPNVVHVVTIDRARSEYKLEVGWPQKKRKFTANQPTSTIASQYDTPPAHDVLAATNGSFFAAVPVIIGTATSYGQILEQPDGDNDTFFFGPSRRPQIATDVAHAAGALTFANGVTLPLDQYNRAPNIHKVTAFTPDYDATTGSTFQAVEVILADVTYPMRGHKEVSGIVTAIRTGAASINNAIPAGGMVLNAWGIPAADVTANTVVGDRLRIRADASSPAYNNADMAITGIGWLVNNGLPNSGNWGQYGSFVNVRHPRTALGWNDEQILMVVCDGRSGVSVGMTFAELADFLINTLDAMGAINLDGGGSSTMVVNGAVRNVPSDGSQRAVSNAVMLVKNDTSTQFPFADPFASAGRLAGWDDKFTYNEVIPFAPTSPGGDGYVIRVADPAGGVETMRRGDFGDTDYCVQADVYCEYRPADAPDGFERVGLFARENGIGAFGTSMWGNGNCYALTYDSHDGRVRAAKYIDGALTDFLTTPVFITATGWHRFRIDCVGNAVTYRLDDTPLVTANDNTYPTGYFGLAYHEFFNTNANIHGTRADNFVATIIVPISGDMDEDGDVDMTDFGLFQACFTGPTVPQNDPACAKAVLDGDQDVDLDDLNIFLGCMSGTDVPGDPDCYP